MSDLPYVIVRRVPDEKVRESVDAFVRLAISDGEYIGRNQSRMEPSAVIELREKCRGTRLGEILGLACASVSLEEIVEVLNLFRLSDECWRLLDLDRRPDDDTVYSWPVAHYRKVRSLLDRLSNKGEE